MYKKLTLISLLFSAGFCFAEEIPGQKDFLDTYRQIEKDSALLDAEMSKHDQKADTDAAAFDKKLEKVVELMKAQKTAKAAFKSDPTDDNWDAKTAAERAASRAKTEVIEDMTDSVLADSRYVENLSQKFYKLGNAMLKLSTLAEGMQVAGLNLQGMRTEIESSISASAGFAYAALADVDPETSEDVKETLSMLNTEALMTVDSVEGLSVNEQIRREGERLKDHAATLLKAKSILDTQKKNIALAGLQVFISDVEAGLEDMNGKTSSKPALTVTTKVKTRNDQITKFKDTLKTGSTTTPANKAANAAPERYEGLENIMNKNKK